MTIKETLQRLLDENSYSLAKNQGRIIDAKSRLIKTKSNERWIESLQEREQRIKEERLAFMEALACIETIKNLTI